MRLAHSRIAGRMACALVLLAACSHAKPPDAFGNIEATEIVVSAQTSGQLLWFSPVEGVALDTGALIAVVDTTQIALQRRQTADQRAGNSAHVDEVALQVKSLEAQREGLVAQKEIAQRTFDRTQRLFAQQAATAQQMDQADQSNRVLASQIASQDQQIDAMRAEVRTAGKDVSYNAARVAQFADQIAKSAVRNPIRGTVLTAYAKPGEFVQPGTPLYKIANLDTLELRAYVSETQLAIVKLGATAQLSFDSGAKERRMVSGTVDWISASAEFTPTPIETQDERKNLVYAVKIRVPNTDGTLKIGMPADVRFPPLKVTR
jgi:HlyD family secretion protein